ncbi:MAG: hypothetical protein HXX09_09465 [Bacteroidetes bacterium]|nr:hypothetical protein [Bacteroidota bacterium]
MKTKEQFHVHQFIFTAIFIVLFLFFGKIGSAQSNENYFDVKTSMETWAGGAAGSGSSTNYTFKIKFKKNVSIRFDTIWFGNMPKLANNANSSIEKLVAYKSGDSTTISIGFYYPGENDRIFIDDNKIEVEEKNSVEIFPNFRGVAIIQFYIGREKYYYEVKKIDESIFNALP